MGQTVTQTAQEIIFNSLLFVHNIRSRVHFLFNNIFLLLHFCVGTFNINDFASNVPSKQYNTGLASTHNNFANLCFISLNHERQ